MILKFPTDRMGVIAGDIIAIRGIGWLSDGIIKAEYGDNSPPQAVSHVGLLIEGDPIPVVIEALDRVRTNPLAVTIGNCHSAFILRDKSLTLGQRQTIVNKACTFSAADYGYLDIGAQWLNAKFKTTWWTDRLGALLNRWPICSYVVAAAYDAVGLSFGIDDVSCKPSDIMNFALTHPEIYEVGLLAHQS